MPNTIQTGQRYFGENYAQELMAKSAEMPDDVAWHFIGPLQSNKAAPLVKTVGLDKLACIETISELMHSCTQVLNNIPCARSVIEASNQLAVCRPRAVGNCLQG